MALIKENLDYGFKANYWRIINVSIDILSNTAMVSIALYTNKEAQKSLEVRTVNAYNDTFLKYFSKRNIINYKDLYEASYFFLKENDEYFKEAKDDNEELLRS